MARVRAKISFDRPYRLRDDESREESIEGLTALWRGWLGPDVANLKVEIVWAEEGESEYAGAQPVHR